MVILKSERGVNMEISNNLINIDFKIGRNIRLINNKYNPVRKEENAVAIEWMIKGKEALGDFLVRIGLRYNNLGKILRERLKSDLENIQKDAEKISRNNKQHLVPFKDKPLRDKDIEITVKWVKGKWRASFPSVNIVIPLSECKRRRLKYYWSLTFKQAIEIGYGALYWISASEVSDSKGLKTAEKFFGKIK